MTAWKQQLKKTDAAFSKFIRTRDCLRTTGDRSRGRCFTCGNAYSIAQLDCGHYVKRRVMTLRFDPTNAHAQCIKCNRLLDGNMPAYTVNMHAYYCMSYPEKLRRKRFAQPRTYSVSELAEMEAYYKQKTKELDESNCGRPFPFVKLSAKGKKTSNLNPDIFHA